MTLKHEFFLQAVADSQFLTDGICEHNVVLYLRVSKQDEGLLTEGPLQSIQKEIQDANPTSLDEFTDCVNKTLLTFEFQSSFAFAAAYLVEDRIYLSSDGLGGVFLIQNDVVTRLIMGKQNASGHLENANLLVIGPYDLIINNASLSHFRQTGESFDEVMIPLFKDIDIGGFIVTVRSANTQSIAPQYAISQQDIGQDAKHEIEKKTTEPQQEDVSLSSSTPNTPIKKNKIRLIVSGIIIFVLIWSVLLGQQRRARQDVINQAKKVAPQIDSKLLDAEEAIEFDPVEAKSLLTEAQNIFEPVKKNAEKNNISDKTEIKTIQDKINTLFTQIDQLENKKPDEFYDVTLLNRNTAISRFVTSDADSIGLLDAKHKHVYQVTIEKKSIKTYSFSKLLDAKAGVIDNDRLFFLTTAGVYAGIEKTEKKVVSNDGWGEVIDVALFNGNIYVLDRGKDELYKYLVVDENTFSKKTSYFKSGQSVDLSDAVGFAVDGSIYIVTESGKVLKYTSGLQQPLSLKLPRPITATKILTNENTDNLFIFDKQKGSVFVFSKEGEFKKEITSKFLKKALDVTLIAGDTLVFAVDSKLYSIK